MTAVLIESNQPGRSSWTVVSNHHREVVFKGLSVEDQLKIIFWNSTKSSALITTNGNITIPDGTKRVRAEHIKASGSLVSVELA